MNYKFFWTGEFSNWYQSNFTIDNKTFTCVEQYMMYVKAITFNDLKSANDILHSTNPKEMKFLGRNVKDYKEDVWSVIRFDVVKRAVKAKFTQNLTLKTLILQYKGILFVEASPYDKIWGIGFAENEALENIDKWGKNLLGKVITEVCNEIYTETIWK